MNNKCTTVKLSSYQPIGTKIIECIDCGCDVEVDAKDTKTERCEQCYKEYRTIKNREKSLRYYNKHAKDKTLPDQFKS